MDSREARVFRTAFNLASSWGRRKGAEQRANRRAGTHERSSSEHDLAEVIAVRRAVAGLPDRQRAVIVTRFYLGYDVAATAALLGCAPGTVKAATHQALENLRRSGLVNDLPEEVQATDGPGGDARAGRRVGACAVRHRGCAPSGAAPLACSPRRRSHGRRPGARHRGSVGHSEGDRRSG